MTESDRVVVNGNWLVSADRETIYSIISNFEQMPEHFPKVARSIKILSIDGNRLSMEAEAASFGRIFPRVRVLIEAELIPGRGYRCSTHNLTFNTRGKEELLLIDEPDGTRVQYSYIITVRRRWLRPLFAWLTRTFGLPYWKRSFLKPLEMLASQQSLPLQNKTATSIGQQGTAADADKPRRE